ncbi:hypothetical protein JZ751_008202, partial [Albula glossodonta]
MWSHPSAVFLCIATAIACVSSSPGPSLSCCLSVSDTKVHPKNIVDYTIQHDSLCPIEAIVFQMRKGGTICSEPGSAWAVRVMKKVDRKKKTKREGRKASLGGEGHQKKKRDRAGGRRERRQPPDPPAPHTPQETHNLGERGKRQGQRSNVSAAGRS